MKRMAAFTLSELLVYMLIAGVIFLAVMEGFLLLNRYARRQSEAILSRVELYDSYSRLVFIMESSDSIAEDNGIIELFNSGRLLGEISVNKDSLLTVIYNSILDTLFGRVIEVTMRGDSLLLETLNSNDGVIRLRFVVRPNVAKKAENKVEDKEKEYRYE